MHWILAWLALLQIGGPAMPFRAIPSVPYKVVNGRTLAADVFLPKHAVQPTPVVVFVHGGLWAWGAKTDYVDFAGELATEGTAAVLIDFREPNGHGFAGQVADIKDAIRWVRSHAVAYGFDPNRVGLFGSSSGAQLAALAAFAGDGQGFGDDPPGTSSRVQACFLLYGVYDLNSEATSPLIALVARVFLGASVKQDPALYALNSPITYVNGNDPPTLVMHGEDDHVVPIQQARQFVAALQAVGVPATLVAVPHEGHGFARLKPWTRPMVYQTMRDFFRETLGGVQTARASRWK